MKKILLLFFLFFIVKTNAQPPQLINYQGVARDSVGHPLLNQNIGIRLSILDSSATGQAVYSEIHQALTNTTGLFNLGIGVGTVVSGNFSEINWGQNNKWLKIEMDATGGANYQLIGSQQFLSVPYALYSGSSSMINTYSVIMPSNVSTTSVSYVAVPGCSISPPTGTYLVTFSGTGGSRFYFYYSLFKNTTIVQESEQAMGNSNSSNAYESMHTQAIITVEGTDTIDLRYKVISSKPIYPGFIKNGHMILLKIGN